LKPADREALRILAKVAARREDLARAFAVVRRCDDAELLAALDDLGAGVRAAKTRGRRKDASLEAEVRARLSPLLASAQEKADALADRMAREAGGAPVRARGFAKTVRALADRYGEAAVRSGAQTLMAEIAAAAGRDGPP
jgi:hypothetical protein